MQAIRRCGPRNGVFCRIGRRYGQPARRLDERAGVFPLSKPVEALLKGGIQGVVGDIRSANVALSGLVGQGDTKQEIFPKVHNAHNPQARPQPLICAR